MVLKIFSKGNKNTYLRVSRKFVDEPDGRKQATNKTYRMEVLNEVLNHMESQDYLNYKYTEDSVGSMKAMTIFESVST